MFARRPAHHRITFAEQRIEERIDALLQHRLPASYFHQAASVAAHAFDDLIDCHLPAFIEGVLSVTPYASQIASREPHEHTGAARVSRLALATLEKFVDAETRCDFRQVFCALPPALPPSRA